MVGVKDNYAIIVGLALLIVEGGVIEDSGEGSFVEEWHLVAFAS